MKTDKNKQEEMEIEEVSFDMRRQKSILKSNYADYRLLEERINRKYTQKNPKKLEKLLKKQKFLGQQIDLKEERISEYLERRG